MTVIEFSKKKNEYDPHVSGKAKCIDCKHEWVAVAPTAVTWLECPSCSLVRGRFIFQCERQEPHWHCKCDNDLFHVTSRGYYCPNCGEWQHAYYGSGTLTSEWVCVRCGATLASQKIVGEKAE